MAATNDENYSSDKPINSPFEDAFERYHFAQRVADTFKKREDPASLVVGLYAPWGDGKTSVLHMINYEIKDSSDIISVSFNPWIFTSETELIKGLFNSLASALERKLTNRSQEISAAVVKYGGIASLAGSVFGIESIIKGATEVAEKFSSVELEETKNRIIKILSEEGKKVIVFIDDIDRLDKNEIYAVFKLVKLTAEFDYISYILAFDDDVVISSLSERYGGSKEVAGRKFLEKIVQIPLRLPPLRNQNLRNFAFNQIDEAIRETETSLDELQIREFAEGYIYGLESRLTTPRLAKLYANDLKFNLPLLKGEVHPVDLMLLEGIKVLYPQVYELIRNNGNLFLQPYGALEKNTPERAKEVRDIIGDTLHDATANQKEGLIRLLRKIFPKLESVYGNMFHGNETERIWTTEKRACSQYYFDKYIHYGVSKDEVADFEMQEIIKYAHDGNYLLNLIIAKILQDKKQDSLVSKLRHIEDEISVDAGLRIACEVAKHSNKLSNPAGFFGLGGVRSQAAFYANRLIERLHGEQARMESSRRIIQSSGSVSFSFDFISHLRLSSDKMNDTPILNEDRRGDLEKEVLSRVIVDMSGKYVGDVFPNDINYIGHMLLKHGGSEEFKSSIQMGLSSAAANIVEILKAFSGTSWGTNTPSEGVKTFGREGYETLSKLSDPNLIADKIIEHFGDKITDYDEYSRVISNEQRLGIQFLKFHKYALEHPQEADTPESDDAGT